MSPPRQRRHRALGRASSATRSRTCSSSSTRRCRCGGRPSRAGAAAGERGPARGGLDCRHGARGVDRDRGRDRRLQRRLPSRQLPAWSDVLLLEKGELTSGSTHHAAGLVTQFNPSPTMMRFRRYSIELYRELGVFERVGSVRIASSADRLLDLRRAASRAAGIGLRGRADRRRARCSSGSRTPTARVHGGVWLPDDGSRRPAHRDPRARRCGARARRRDPPAHARARDRARRAPRGPRGAHRKRADRDRARRQRGRHLGAAGRGDGRAPSSPRCRSTTSTSRWPPSPATRSPRDAPCFRDTDNLVYGRGEAGGDARRRLRARPVSRWSDGVPWEHGSSPVRVGHGSLRAAARGRDPPLPVPRAAPA